MWRHLRPGLAPGAVLRRRHANGATVDVVMGRESLRPGDAMEWKAEATPCARHAALRRAGPPIIFVSPVQDSNPLLRAESLQLHRRSLADPNPVNPSASPRSGWPT